MAAQEDIIAIRLQELDEEKKQLKDRINTIVHR